MNFLTFFTSGQYRIDLTTGASIQYGKDHRKWNEIHQADDQLEPYLHVIFPSLEKAQRTWNNFKNYCMLIMLGAGVASLSFLIMGSRQIIVHGSSLKNVIKLISAVAFAALALTARYRYFEAEAKYQLEVDKLDPYFEAIYAFRREVLEKGLESFRAAAEKHITQGFPLQVADLLTPNEREKLFIEYAKKFIKKTGEMNRRKSKSIQFIRRRQSLRRSQSIQPIRRSQLLRRSQTIQPLQNPLTIDLFPELSMKHSGDHPFFNFHYMLNCFIATKKNMLPQQIKELVSDIEKDYCLKQVLLNEIKLNLSSNPSEEKAFAERFKACLNIDIPDDCLSQCNALSINLMLR